MVAPARIPQGTNPSDTCSRVYVSDPIAAQTLTGTIKGQALCIENAAANNICAQLLVKIVSGDGTTVRGTSLAHITSAETNEFVITRTNRFFPRGGGSPSLTSVTASAGDRIVFEIGIRQESTNVTSIGHIQFGDDGGADLPEDETTTTATSNPWIELSQTITFQGAAEVIPYLVTARRV